MREMRLILLFALFVLCVFPSQAKKVDVEKAEVVAKNYLKSGNVQLRSDIKLTLAYTKTKQPTTRSGSMSGDNNGIATFYVFSKGDNQGFIIVSADDVAIPVIGNSDKGNYDVDNLPPNFAYWMDNLSQQIAYAIDNQLPQDSKTESQWESYYDGNITLYGEPLTVKPLLQTEWGQDSPYNDSCPKYNEIPSLTGCVATAMAQIMNFHQYPSSWVTMSNEISGYTTDGDYADYPITIPAIAGNRTYNWNNMVKDFVYGESSIDGKKAVARLMYHCGVSVQMDYGLEASGAVSKKVGIALCEYFGYDQGGQYLEREYYNPTDWNSILRAEIDASRPVLYSGSGIPEGEMEESGHAFICDGYKGEDEFHINWGWEGYCNGYFPTYALNPETYDVTYNFNDEQEILIGIRANMGGSIVPNIRIVEGGCLSSATDKVNRKEDFKVSSTFVNRGLFTFNGDLGIALVDGSDKVICILGKPSWSIPSLPNGSGYYSPFELTCSVPESTKAGDYFIRAVAKSSGSDDWVIVRGPVDGCPDKLPITVLGPAEATWSPKNEYAIDWNIPENWTTGIPGPTTKVTIPSAATYPILYESTTVSSILFKPGAELGRQDLLVYDKAFVEYYFDEGTRSTHFRMLSVPLKQAYPGDFTFGGKPNAYVQTLEVDDESGMGQWVTAAGGTTDAFEAGTGFVLSLDPDNSSSEGLGLSEGILRLPFYDSESDVAPNVHGNHSYDGSESKFTDPYGGGGYYTVPRNDGDRLADPIVNVTPNFGSTSGGSSSFALVGNPFMSTIDFSLLHHDNSDLIKNNYQIWASNGVKEGYVCYSDEGVVGLEGVHLNGLITPLQGFVVEHNSGTNPLEFNLENISIRKILMTTSKQITKNKLDIVAKNSKASVRTFIAERDGGSVRFGERDARKLMNGITDVPEVYTLKPSDKGLMAVGMNITAGESVEYPVGLATSFDGVMTLTFSGMDSYDAKIFFTDRLLGKEIEITNMKSYEYTFNYTPSGKGTTIKSTDDRFYIRIMSDEVSNENIDAQQLSVYSEQGFIHAVSAISDIDEIRIYNLQGAEVYHSAVNNRSYTTTRTFIPGMYVVVIKTGNGLISNKIMIK